ncbi:MAG: penicillin-binding protein 2, partial [Oscillospiraceae bacterium]|nr:penicillin-binding protein 2 [Oscillospiraceae bacterium]
IQRITETALQALKPCPGAAVVLDCRTGDILASASTPVYNPDRLADSLDDPQSPFLNRALCAFNVGSVFKLVTAAAALEHGLTPQFMHTCTGSTTVYGQVFRCHNRSGHGLLDMTGALNASCNPYFIELSALISAPDLHHTAELLGFGEEITLAPGIRSVSGLLPDAEALKIPAEKANLSFGQGALLATPLQVCAMTACLANSGIFTTPRLVVGTTDGSRMPQMTDPDQRYALHPETARTLCDMMQTVLTDESHANGCPSNTTAGGKTSTAQTGRFAEDGTERCHAWMTGFFPADSPRYAVTVFAEDGGSGNETAAPVFRRIIEEITRAERR